HAVPAAGTENLTVIAEASLPLVTEADIGIRELSAGVTRMLDLYRAGKAPEAQAAAVDLPRARDTVTRPLARLDADLQRQIADWVAKTEGETQLQLIVLLALVLAATGLGGPLGYVCSK